MTTKQTSKLYLQIKDINSREELADFVSALRNDLEAHQSDWENPTLERFLAAMESWIRSMDNYYKNTGQEIPSSPTWQTLGDILYAARIYE